MKRFKGVSIYAGLILLAAMVIGANVYAGVGGQAEFQALYDTITAWATGYLGRALAIIAFLLGMGMAVVQQSLMPVAVGIGAAAAFAYTPTVLNAVLSATIS